MKSANPRIERPNPPQKVPTHLKKSTNPTLPICTYPPQKVPTLFWRLYLPNSKSAYPPQKSTYPILPIVPTLLKIAGDTNMGNQ
jgi:hypothetical protein